jgi:hypothetical protein
MNVIIAMPYKDKTLTVTEEDKGIVGQTVVIEETRDIIHLHYLFFDKQHLYNNDMQIDYSFRTFRSSDSKS